MEKTLSGWSVLAVVCVALPGTAFAELTVVPPPAPPVAVHRPHSKVLPYYIPPRTPKVRCEQDRLLTDTRTCGDETATPIVVVPKRLKRCEQDRMINDTSPCGNGTEAK